MIAPMGRFAKIWTLGVVCAVVATSWVASAGQSGEPNVIRGPTYTLSELRQIEIEGVRLGMSEGAASDVLAGRGYTPVADGLPGELNFYSPDRQTRIAFEYLNDRRPRIVETIVLQRSISGRDMMDVEARRAEILASLGRPTHWTRSVDRFGYPYDDFYYATNRVFPADFVNVWGCRYNWRCSDVDCRTYLRHMRTGAAISVDFGMSGYWIQAFDFSHYAARMRRDQNFMTRDLSAAVCRVLPIH
jgi:hypothetical protein